MKGSPLGDMVASLSNPIVETFCNICIYHYHIVPLNLHNAVCQIYLDKAGGEKGSEKCQEITKLLVKPNRKIVVIEYHLLFLKTISLQMMQILTN